MSVCAASPHKKIIVSQLIFSFRKILQFVGHWQTFDGKKSFPAILQLATVRTVGDASREEARVGRESGEVRSGTISNLRLG